MRKSLTAFLLLLLALSITAAAQNNNANANTASPANSNTTTKTTKKRGPIFRATKDQIKQAQAILKQRGFYGGEASGKLDTDTRAGLKKYQEAESLKVTGTLNNVTTIPQKTLITSHVIDRWRKYARHGLGWRRRYVPAQRMQP
ncbi:MAG: peptidoglycan-binding protein [Pyrinomonadaceae bacterium]|nr:peptidoglycan-binding protein [Pyrinomonadaceae bacterium]